MQALIDVIIEQLIQKVGIFHRPCPDVVDWTKADLAASTAWLTRDCSAFVPIGTQAVVLDLHGQTSAAGRELLFRTPGDTKWWNYAYFRMVDANEAQTGQVIVSLDETLSFESKASSTTWSSLFANISAYWMTGIVQNSFHDRGDPSVVDFDRDDFIRDFTWHELDLSGIIPVNTTAVLCTVQIRYTSGGPFISFRTSGNSNTINVSKCTTPASLIVGSYDITIPTSGLQKIEYISTLVTDPIIDFTVKGWWF